MDTFTTSAFDHSQYMPHGMCYMWRPDILWPTVISDAVTAVAYLAFALAIITFVRRREDLPDPAFFILAGSIIFLACGTSHLLSAVVIWNPLYGYLAVVKVMVAVSSVAAAILLWRLLPVFLAIPSPALLEVKNQDLEREIKVRTKMERDAKNLNTQLRVARDVAEQAIQAKSQFLTTMSHEIRTPMNGVLGTMELLQLTKLNQEQAKYTRILRRSGHTLMRIIDDILDFSKIEVGKLVLENTQFNMTQLIEDSVSFLDVKVMDGIDLVIEVDPAIPANLKGDPTRLHQVITNLLNNAFKFTAEGSVRLQVSAEPTHNRTVAVNFNISDTGLGMTEDVTSVIFQPFTQADQSTSRKYGGSGLGLSICKNLVELMGGEIGVESEPGRGSRFHFRIVFDIARQPLIDAAEKSASSVDYSGLRVLLAEDNDINQQIAISLIAKLGVTPDLVADGSSAVSKFRKQAGGYDLILMDCEMPVLDGYEAAKQIRQFEADNDLQPTIIYALSAHVLSDHLDACHAAGMNDSLSKPISFEQIKMLFGTVISMREVK